jgi:hypothetical protein
MPNLPVRRSNWNAFLLLPDSIRMFPGERLLILALLSLVLGSAPRLERMPQRFCIMEMGGNSMRALSSTERFPLLHLSRTMPFGSNTGFLPRKLWLPRLSGMTCSTLLNGPSDPLQYRHIGKTSSHA